MTAAVAALLRLAGDNRPEPEKLDIPAEMARREALRREDRENASAP